MTLPRIIIERCHYLAECTEEPGAITRPFASDAMQCAQALVRRLYDDLRENYRDLGDRLRDSVSDMPPTGYIVAQRYLRQVGDALRVLEDPRAADYFTKIKPLKGYVKVEEAAEVPKTYVGAGAMRFVSKGAEAGKEPIGQRIITVPQDEDAAEARNPRHGFIHYVPPGSIKKGEDLRPISPEIMLTRWGSATAVSESPLNPDVLWAGTDDGALWVTRNGGKISVESQPDKGTIFRLTLPSVRAA